MPTNNENKELYYGTLNPLSRRLTEAVKSGEEWSTHNDDEYDGEESLLSMLKIKCGEKIVVDFENDDGWTWRDEHSGPFSWMTRSQQDLTTLDDNDVQTAGQTKPSRSDTVSRKRLSQQFSSPNGEDVLGGLSEIQAAFQKFGISQVDTDTTENNTDPENKTFTFHSTESHDKPMSHDVVSHDFLSHDTPDTLSPTPEHRMFTTGEIEVCSSSSITPVHKTSNTYNYTSSPAEKEHLMSSTDISTHDTGHISPAFEYDPLDKFREISDRTADGSTQHSPDGSTGHSPDGSTCHSPNGSIGHSPDGSTLQLDGVTLEESCYDNPTDVKDESQEEVKTTQIDMTSSSTSLVTGFDFLDNW